ncbi:hypothetical protein JCM5296_003038 [Sporobolomyces johnsonii]
MSSSQPSVSLYVSNINTKVPKDEVRRALYALFSLYGKVLDVVHVRKEKVRGTAFVVFRDLASSTAAMRGLDGEGFYGKGLRIAYAHSTSHATIALTEGPEAVYAIKLGLRQANGDAGKGSKLTVSGAQKKLIDERRQEKRGREDEEEEEEESDEEEGQPEKKKGRQEEERDEDAMEEESDEDAPEPARPAAPEQGSEPNPILFIEGLPAEVTSDMLSALFQQYPGLSSLKLLPTPVNAPKNSGTAFISYDTAAQAGVALEALDGFLVDADAPMKVGYAKRG